MPNAPFYMDDKHHAKYRTIPDEDKKRIMGKARKQVYEDLDKLPSDKPGKR